VLVNGAPLPTGLDALSLSCVRVCVPLLWFPGLSIPITEVAFENQRFYPLVGWSAKLMPTDRKAWSDEQGLCTDSRCVYCVLWLALHGPWVD
jgi:hypothetical protein